MRYHLVPGKWLQLGSKRRCWRTECRPRGTGISGHSITQNCHLLFDIDTADTCLEAEVGELLHGQPDVPAGRVEDVGDAEVAEVSHVLHRPAAGQQVPRQHLTLSTLQHLKPLTFRTFRYCDS